jgi:hypothetical protein
MNPSSRETYGINLPPPVAEQSPGSIDGINRPSGAPERRAATPETTPRTGTAQPAMAAPATQPSNQPPLDPVAGQKASSASTSTSVTPPVSDDEDKIEKEWVDKARHIVEQNKHDPHRQSEELTMVKADYMKQRYNKIIKVEK